MPKNKLQIPEFPEWTSDHKIKPLDITGKGNAILINTPFPEFNKSDSNINWIELKHRYMGILISLLGNNVFLSISRENKWDLLNDSFTLTLIYKDYLEKIFDEIENPKSDIGYIARIRFYISKIRLSMVENEFHIWRKNFELYTENMQLSDISNYVFEEFNRL